MENSHHDQTHAHIETRAKEIVMDRDNSRRRVNRKVPRARVRRLCFIQPYIS